MPHILAGSTSLKAHLVSLHPPDGNGVEHFFWWDKEIEFPGGTLQLNAGATNAQISYYYSR